jgi:ribose transport system ATP-binding protein
VPDTDSVVLRGLSKQFASTHALWNVDFSVRAGEISGLIGQNGSGKSTLVKILTGIHAADAGTIELWGNAPISGRVDPVREGIAVVHQDHGLVEHMTALDNLAVGARFRRRLLAPLRNSHYRGDYERLAASLGLTLDLDQLVEALRPSERASVAIVRALSLLETTHERRLLILDEPTATLQPA